MPKAFRDFTGIRSGSDGEGLLLLFFDALMRYLFFLHKLAS